MTDSNWHLHDPYVYQAMTTVVGKPVSVQTTRGSVRGKLLKAEPDHIVVNMGGDSFFIRTQQIVWVVPDPKVKN